MAEEELKNNDASNDQAAMSASQPPKKKSSRQLLIISLVFLGLVIMVFISHEDPESITWIEDYNTGLQKAKEQNRPVLLAFYKQRDSHYFGTMQVTYSDTLFIKLINNNFVPVLIFADEQPELVKQYNVTEYPTHYVKPPAQAKLIGPFTGYVAGRQFRKKIRTTLGEMNISYK